MKRNFETWLKSFRTSIADYNYYVDFSKVYANVNEIKVELNILNALIGEPDIENKFRDLVKKYPEILRCIPILLAKREKEIRAMDADGAYVFRFNEQSNSFDEYLMFMRKTGLFDLLQRHIIKDLVDYVTGVETGLDSNARKNRGGHLMEAQVERFLIKAGFVKEETFFSEKYIHQIQDKWGIDLSGVSNDGKTEKRFDFVVKTPTHIYLIETNFYTSGGSKLNETARSYKTLALETMQIPGVTFVWFTDGQGWQSAKNNLQETFDVTDHIYNIQDMENGIMSRIFI